MNSRHHRRVMKKIIILIICLSIFSCTPSPATAPPSIKSQFDSVQDNPTIVPTPTPDPPIYYEREWYGEYKGVINYGWKDSWTVSGERVYRERVFVDKELTIIITDNVWKRDIPINDVDEPPEPERVFVGLGTNPTHGTRLKIYVHISRDDDDELKDIVLNENFLIIETSNEYFSTRLYLQKIPGPNGETLLTGSLRYNFINYEGDKFIRSDEIAASGFTAFSDSFGVYALPSYVSVNDVMRVKEVYDQISRNEISEEGALEKLTAIHEEIESLAMSWILRNLPVYNVQNDTWESFDSYTKGLALEVGVEPDSRLATDPIGTTIDLVYGNPNNNDIINWLGFSP